VEGSTNLRILITGAAGFLGQKLTRALCGNAAKSAPTELVLWDHLPVQAPPEWAGPVRLVQGDLLQPENLQAAFAQGLDVVFHLAAVVSAQAEAEFDLGLRVNLDGTRTLLEACRGLQAPPVFVTTSSVAAFGGDVPVPVPDDQAPTPRSTYGTTKVIGELLVNDFSRKGFIDGRVLRLPTITVRPGKPNKAASSFASGIIREPLNGDRSNCPIAENTPLWLMSPRRAVDALVRAAGIPASVLGDDRVITLPGLTATPAEMVGALERIAGAETAGRVTWRRDPAIEAIVSTWPGAFQAVRARELGFEADASIDEIVRAYMEDDL